MKHIIKSLVQFDKDLKKLSKKYPHIEQDLKVFFNKIKNGALIGEKMKNLNSPIYKARVKSSDNKKGKSGGFRVIYQKLDNILTITLIEIYSKSQKENTTNREIQRRLKNQ